MSAAKARYVERAKRNLKAELKHAGIQYRELAERLTAAGLPENETSITVRINRGTFPAWFFIAVLEVIGASEMRVR
jgi:hypothetical protein